MVPTVVLVCSHSGGEVARWPLERDRGDLETVDEVARLQLAAKRLGCEIRLLDAKPELWELLELAGLTEVMHEAP